MANRGEFDTSALNTELSVDLLMHVSYGTDIAHI